MSRAIRYTRQDVTARSLQLNGTAVTPTAAELNTLAGITAVVGELNTLAGQTGYPIQCAEATFTETAAAGTFTATIALPAGATLIDVIVNAVALWTSQTSATMIVGDGTDPDGYFTAVDMKATDLLAGESISFAQAGGKAGAYIAGSQVSPRYSATARSVIGVITKVGTTGTAGRTRMVVLWAAAPVQTAATYAA